MVSLRPWREIDVPAKLMAFGDPVVQRFSWSRTAPYTEADAGAYFVEQEQARRRGEALHFAVVEPANDDVVLGGGSLYDVDLEQSRAKKICQLADHWQSGLRIGSWICDPTTTPPPQHHARRRGRLDGSRARLGRELTSFRALTPS